MSDHSALLHNMSAPPRTVIKYAGLSGLATKVGPGGAGTKHVDGHVFGSFVAFRLPTGMRVRSAALLLERLGKEVGTDAEETLHGLIERRAMELALPDGCLVKPCERSHPSPWPDPLAALAIITKSSANIWLRGKVPSLSSLAKRSSVSLLLPPTLVDLIPEASP
jgi:hypothetical protein